MTCDARLQVSKTLVGGVLLLLAMCTACGTVRPATDGNQALSTPGLSTNHAPTPPMSTEGYSIDRVAPGQPADGLQGLRQRSASVPDIYLFSATGSDLTVQIYPEKKLVERVLTPVGGNSVLYKDGRVICRQGDDFGQAKRRLPGATGSDGRIVMVTDGVELYIYPRKTEGPSVVGMICLQSSTLDSDPKEMLFGR